MPVPLEANVTGAHAHGALFEELAMPDPKDIRIFPSTSDTDQSTSKSVDSPDPSKTRTPSSTSCMHSNTFADAASRWLEFGLQVIPTLPGTKRTALKWDPWLDGLSEDKIRRHWTEHPNNELGFIVGDDVVVLDADTPQAEAALCAIEEACGVEPNRIHRTKRGAHHLLKLAPDVYVKTDSHNTVDHPARIDIKAKRSLVILPPSPGKEVEIDEGGSVAQLAEANQALIEAIFRHNGREAPRRPQIPQRPSPSPRCDDERLTALGAMLDHIDPDSGYEDWLHVLMAIHHETGGSDEGLAFADAWSSQGQKYCGEREFD